MCVDPLSTNPKALLWNWDDTSSTNSADACALFDSDGDKLVDYALCNEFKGTTQATGFPKLYLCTDAKPLNCSSGVEITKSAGTTCSLAITNTDPFPAGDYYPDDMTSTCYVVPSDVGNGTLLDVCSYPSASPTSSASDCVVRSFNNGNLEILKDVVPDDSSTWNFTVTGPTPITIQNVPDSGTSENRVVLAGTYAIAETANAFYDTTWSCTKNGDAAGSGSGTTISGLVIANADVVVCKFTNTLRTGTLIVEKDLVNDNLGPLTCPDFSYTVDAGNCGRV